MIDGQELFARLSVNYQTIIDIDIFFLIYYMRECAYNFYR